MEKVAWLKGVWLYDLIPVEAAPQTAFLHMHIQLNVDHSIIQRITRIFIDLITPQNCM